MFCENLSSLQNVFFPSHTKYPATTHTMSEPTVDIASKEIEEEDHCLICLGPVVLPTHMSCTCRFVSCRNCLIDWIQAHDLTKCPLCSRTDVKMMSSKNKDVCLEELAAADHINFMWKQLSSNDPSFMQMFLQVSKLFQNAVACDPSNPDGHLGVATVLILGEDFKMAVEYIDYVIEKIDASHPKALAMLEHIVELVGQDFREQFAEIDRLEAEENEESQLEEGEEMEEDEHGLEINPDDDAENNEAFIP